MKKNLISILENFELPSSKPELSPINNGHINDTWKIKFSDHHSYVLQKINQNVFNEPDKVMENIDRVLKHLEKKSIFKKDLQIIKTIDQKLFYEDEQNNYWRIYNFIENASSFDEIPSAEHTYQAAKGFGLFLSAISDLPSPPLHEIIPDFHNTAWRYDNFLKAIPKAKKERLEKASLLIEQAKDLSYLKDKILNLLDQKLIPLRPTHNDTKLNNALLDKDSLETVAVIDLDTLMPGSALYDFGDFVRTAARIGAEDEKDLSKVAFSSEYFEAAIKGFLESTSSFLNDIEVDNLAISSAVITYEMGLRFLTDYLENDIFYKTSHSEQNLHRAQVQFKLIKEMIEYFSKDQ